MLNMLVFFCNLTQDHFRLIPTLVTCIVYITPSCLTSSCLFRSLFVDTCISHWEQVNLIPSCFNQPETFMFSLFVSCYFTSTSCLKITFETWIFNMFVVFVYVLPLFHDHTGRKNIRYRHVQLLDESWILPSMILESRTDYKCSNWRLTFVVSWKSHWVQEYVMPLC